MDELKFNVPNDINIVITTKEKGVLLDDDCCTCINIMLTNEGKIATSFLGTHNPFIVSQLEKAQKEYFKVLKKTLKKDFKEYATAPGFDDDECDCNESDNHKHCHCHDNEETCHCHDNEEHCNCEEDHEKNEEVCNCGASDCKCNEKKEKQPKNKSKEKTTK